MPLKISSKLMYKFLFPGTLPHFESPISVTQMLPAIVEQPSHATYFVTHDISSDFERYIMGISYATEEPKPERLSFQNSPHRHCS